MVAVTLTLVSMRGLAIFRLIFRTVRSGSCRTGVPVDDPEDDPVEGVVGVGLVGAVIVVDTSSVDSSRVPDEDEDEDPLLSVDELDEEL